MRSFVLAVPLLLFTSSVLAQNATTDKIIDAPGNIRAFAPKDTSAPFDGVNVSMRSILDQLGPDGRLWMQHVQTLANPIFEGREAGSRGFELTVEYLEYYMRQYGLSPAFPAGEDDPNWSSYVQDFTYRSFPRRTFQLDDPHLSFGGTVFSHESDFQVLAPSGGDRIDAPLSFVGYAIESEDHDYSSFGDDDDLTGRIAIVLRYEPLDDDGNSRWNENRFSPAARLSPKFRRVAERNAAGIILVNPPGAVRGRGGLESLESSAGFGASRDFPVIQVAPEVADRMLRAADPEGRGLRDWRRMADNGEVGSVDLADDVAFSMGGSVDVDMDRTEAPSANVAGVLWGHGDLRDEWVVVGAHCDHVGMGQGGGAMPGGRGTLHPGADDNASGTAGMLVMAKLLSAYYAAAGDLPRRSILFMGFGAEEVGLRGSAYFVQNPTIDLESISLMVNMDMIGRLRSDTLMIGGTGTAVEMEAMLLPHVMASDVIAAYSPIGTGPSDHANFYRAEVPVLFMFTGLHDEYHQPGDHAWTVNPAGAVSVVELSESIVRDVVARPEQLTFQTTGRGGRASRDRETQTAPVVVAVVEPEPEPESVVETTTPPVSSGGVSDRTGAKVRFGVHPNYTAEIETGVLVDGVTEGTSADKAGIQQGDILLTWGDTDIASLRQFAELLRAHKPGDVINITIQRDGKTITKSVTLGAAEEG